MNETQENKQITEPGKEEFEKTDIFGVGAPTTDLHSTLQAIHF